MMVEYIVIISLLCLLAIAIDSLLWRRKKKNPVPTPKMTEKKYSHTSILGESRYQLSQSLPNDATPEKTDEQMENNSTEGSTFALSEVEEGDCEPMDIDAPLLEREDSDDDEFDEEEEEIREIFGPDAILASGISVDEMYQTHKVIEDAEPTPKEEQQAGRILYQNKKTDMFEQLASTKPNRLERIRNLMYIHEKKLEMNEEISDSPVNNSDYNDFDINNFVR